MAGSESRHFSLIVAGGGAAGFFAAVTAAEAGLRNTAIFEAGRRFLDKVRISGGGRCNVTHGRFLDAVPEFAAHYPRGARELRGPLTRFGARDTMAWFQARGVELKTEADGRVFPRSDDSADIVRTLLDSARRAGVQIFANAGIRSVRAEEGRYVLETSSGDTLTCEQLILACGGDRRGFRLAEALGHTIVAPVPSIFTLELGDGWNDLAGLSVERVVVSLPEIGEGRQRGRLAAEGPLLITHWGLSGPAILRLSAFAARELYACEYITRLRIDFYPDLNEEEVRAAILETKARAGARQAGGEQPRFETHLPGRLWRRIAESTGVANQRWAEVSAEQVRRLTGALRRLEFHVSGKGVFKEEFVTAGGVHLGEVDLRTFESRRHAGLFFAGEILDIDGITGGFNFQSAWTAGRLAGLSAAERALRRDVD